MHQCRHNLLDSFILISGCIILHQFIPLLNVVRSPVIIGSYVLTNEVISIMILAIITLSLALLFYALLSILPNLLPKINREKNHLIPLTSGSIITGLGLASINISGVADGGETASFFSIGIELVSLGTISLSSFVNMMGERHLIKNVPNYAVLLFFLSLVPVAFTISI